MIRLSEEHPIPNIDVSAENLKKHCIPDTTPHPIGKVPASGIVQGQVPHLWCRCMGSGLCQS